jgi:membrane protease YdiL (CAAX protease family)
MDVTRKGIGAYVAIAFGFAWLLWEAAFQLGGTASVLVFYLGAFAPAIAAIVVRKWVTREGFGDAGIRINVGAWPYYLFAWLLPLAVILVIAAEATVFSIAEPDFSVQAALLVRDPKLLTKLGPNSGALIIVLQLIRALVTIPLLWGEEFGWRGYLQPRLAPGKPLLAAVLTGIIWAVWHYPLILRGANYPGNPWLGLLLFPVTSIFLSIIFGWLREQSGSIWVSSLAHSSINAVGGSLSLMWYFSAAHETWLGIDIQTWTGIQGILAWLPLGAICAWVLWSRRTSKSAATAGPVSGQD